MLHLSAAFLYSAWSTPCVRYASNAQRSAPPTCSDDAAGYNVHKASRAANRLNALLDAPFDSLSDAEQKELSGLAGVDKYDEGTFTPEHAAFKATHNQVLVDLARHCGGEDPTCFYLDGPGGRTTQALIDAGYSRARLYTANWHPTTCDALTASPHRLPKANVARCRAADALRSESGAFGSVRFHALYLDGCGGVTQPLIDCVEALIHESRRPLLPRRFAIGFTLTEAEPSGTPLVDREVAVHQALAAACRAAGYRMHHVSDEPWHYGVSPSIRKKDGCTQTFWMVCTDLGSEGLQAQGERREELSLPSQPPKQPEQELSCKGVGAARARRAARRSGGIRMEVDDGAAAGSIEEQINAFLASGDFDDEDEEEEEDWVWEGAEEDWEAAADEFELNSEWLAKAVRESEAEAKGESVPAVHPSAPAHARPLDETDEAVFIARALREEAYLGPGGEFFACTPVSAAASVVTAQGVARIDDALNKSTAAALHAYVLDSFETRANEEKADQALQATANASSTSIESQITAFLANDGENNDDDDDDDDVEEEEYGLIAVGSGTQRLSRLEMHSGGGGSCGQSGAEAASDTIEERRWDLRLSPSHPVVRRALDELFGEGKPLGAAFEELAGRDAYLWEVAAIMSAPGCPPQIVHADASWTPQPLLITAFIALQDVCRDMGPTRFIPRTHNDPSHAAVVATDDATSLGAGSPPSSCVGLLQAGDATLYDGRLLHCGGANRSDKRRILMYVTFRSRAHETDAPHTSTELGPMTLGNLIERAGHHGA